MIPTDLFEFAYVPDWYGQLDELAGAVAVQKASRRNQKYRYADFRAVHQYYLSQAKH